MVTITPRIVPSATTLVLSHIRARASGTIRSNRFAGSQYYIRHQYSSLRRRAVDGTNRGRISARTTAPSRANALANTHGSNAAPLAGAASTLNQGQHSTPQEETRSAIVEGLDIADTPAIVPDDPFGVLQPHDTAYKLLAQSALIMTRQVEMMNVLVGFEQANKYAIVDPSGAPIGFIAEDDTTFLKAMSRQVLRTHRPFKASVFDLEGNEILKIHRPFAFINSRIMISTPDDRLIGEVEQEWHLIRRRYNMFTVDQPDPETFPKDADTTAISTKKKTDSRGMNRVQFASIDGGFLALDFDMQNENGQKIASVNRNFVGFARELFTDSGQYALRFDAAVFQELQQRQGLGATPATQDLEQAKDIQAQKDEKALAQLEAIGGLTLDQRAIMLACAVSIDFDYFSRHSGNGGIMPNMMMMGGPAHVPSNSTDGPAGAAGTAGTAGMPIPPSESSIPESGGGNDPPTSTNQWGEDVWGEDSGSPEDSGDSWFGGGKGGGDSGGEGGGFFNWGDLLDN
ncbi:hypothetical protein BGZ76_000206 [Entomortierella beljakovae]|nr:hypothetical protein BGZ76_000206 [Entomortierella beljakovae]